MTARATFVPSAVCRRDGTSTKLRCAQCHVGICPKCLVRTPIGYKCPGCAGEAVATRGLRRPRFRVVAGAALVGLAAYVGLTGAPGDSALDPVSVPAPAAGAASTDQAVIGEEATDGQLVFVVDDFACTGPAGGGGKALHASLQREECQHLAGHAARALPVLVDAQSRTYGADEALTRAASDNGNRRLSGLNINSGVVVAMVFVYDVPAAVDPTEAQFRGTGRGGMGVNVRLERRA